MEGCKGSRGVGGDGRPPGRHGNSHREGEESLGLGGQQGPVVGSDTKTLLSHVPW